MVLRSSGLASLRWKKPTGRPPWAPLRIAIAIPVPVSPSFTGLLLSGQGGLLDVAQPAGFALSNAVTLIVN